ncbi:MAG TPA: peptide ABC transporter substrate-binding protein, partial [Dongiaceae bacterium]|nr:peptide ABC transporter substrate-binding protein [Dongiaceae bacterium]
MDFVTLKAIARQRKISRRDFIGLAVAGGLTVVAADRLFISTALAATPKPGGRFRLGVSGANTTDSNDPAT